MIWKKFLFYRLYLLNALKSSWNLARILTLSQARTWSFHRISCNRFSFNTFNAFVCCGGATHTHIHTHTQINAIPESEFYLWAHAWRSNRCDSYPNKNNKRWISRANRKKWIKHEYIILKRSRSALCIKWIYFW